MNLGVIYIQGVGQIIEFCRVRSFLVTTQTQWREAGELTRNLSDLSGLEYYNNNMKVPTLYSYRRRQMQIWGTRESAHFESPLRSGLKTGLEKKKNIFTNDATTVIYINPKRKISIFFVFRVIFTETFRSELFIIFILHCDLHNMYSDRSNKYIRTVGRKRGSSGVKKFLEAQPKKTIKQRCIKLFSLQVYVVFCFFVFPTLYLYVFFFFFQTDRKMFYFQIIRALLH